MGEWRTWLAGNWFNFIQTLGIMGGFVVAVVTMRRETRSRQFGDYLTVIQQHRELWGEAHRRSDLSRLFHLDVDLVATPVTVAEEEYLNLVIDHFHTGWLLARSGVVLRMDVLEADARAFFRLPLPRRAWEMTRGRRNPHFVRFVEEALKKNGS